MAEDRFGTATLAFQETLEQLDIPDEALSDEEVQTEIGRRGALLATAGLHWERHLGPMLGWRQVAELLGTVATRQGVNDLQKRRRLIGLRSKSGELAYPLFQLSEGKPLPGLPRVLEAFDGAGVDSWTVASWLVTPQELLEGGSPADALKSGASVDLVVEAARRTAAGLEH
jgi:hypothetical protein